MKTSIRHLLAALLLLCTAAVQAQLTGVVNGTSLPIRFGQESDGLPGEKTNEVYRWESPAICLNEEISALRFTVFKTHSERNYEGTEFPFIVINEFELYKVTGEKIELTENNFTTNSEMPDDGIGIPGLCDGRTENGSIFRKL